MSVTRLSICNLALSRLGITSFIASINETTKEAQCCNRVYELTRDRVLSEAPWGFATSYADLQDIGTPPDEWAYRYRYPADCLKIQRLGYPADNDPDLIYSDDAILAITSLSTPFAVLEDSSNNSLALVCNISPLRVRYTRRITIETLYPPQFVNALAWALAAELAAPLSGDMRNANAASVAYNSALGKAIADSLNEQIPAQPPDSDFISARL